MCEQTIQTTRLNYLNAAITDVSNWIRFMDTKVAAIIAADMLLLTSLLTSTKDLLPDVYNEKINSPVITWLAIALFVFFILSTGYVYYFGISTLLARVGKTKGKIGIAGEGEATNTSDMSERVGQQNEQQQQQTSHTKCTSWFIPNDDYKIEEYIPEFFEKTSETLIQEMAEELYKLNAINRVKMEKANKTLKAFNRSLISIVVIFALFFVENYLRAATKPENAINTQNIVQKTQTNAQNNVSEDNTDSNDGRKLEANSNNSKDKTEYSTIFSSEDRNKKGRTE